MEFLTGIGAGVAQSMLSNPAVQSLLMGAVVKVVVDKLKEVLKLVDTNGVPADKKQVVQGLVLVCSFLATVGDLALKGQLGTLDPSSAVQFVVTWLSTQLLANGAHETAKAAKAVVKK